MLETIFNIPVSEVDSLPDLLDLINEYLEDYLSKVDHTMDLHSNKLESFNMDISQVSSTADKGNVYKVHVTYKGHNNLNQS